MMAALLGSGGRAGAVQSLSSIGRAFANPVLPAIRSPQRIGFPVAAKSTQADNNADEDKEMRDEAKEATQRAKETMREGWEKMEVQAQAAKDKTKEAKEWSRASDASEKVEEEPMRHDAEVAEDETREGKSRVVEGVQHAGGKAMETVQGAWDAAKETVVGRAEETRDGRRMGEGSLNEARKRGDEKMKD